MNLPEKHTDLVAAVLRYRTWLDEETHHLSQRVKAQGNGLEAPGRAYLNGKVSGLQQAMLALEAELAGNGGREVQP